MDTDIPLDHQYYCTDCRKIVGQRPKAHKKEVHEGEENVKILPIKRGEGKWIAKPSTMHPCKPHIWMDVDGEEKCVQCSAVAIVEGPERSSPNGTHQFGVYE